MFKLTKQILFRPSLPRIVLNQLQNGMIIRTCSASYDGDGKTTVKVLNNDPEMGLMVNSYSEVRDEICYVF